MKSTGELTALAAQLGVYTHLRTLFSYPIRSTGRRAIGDTRYARPQRGVGAACADAAGARRWNFWRPIVGIRDFCNDENDVTCTDWQPLGSPSTNGPATSRFSPNFPAYPSGHAAFGTAALTVAQLELNLPATFTFTFLSDELNGINFDIDAAGTEIVRPRAPRTLTIDQAIQGNLRGRVFLGVHWNMDGTMGSVIGTEIAQITQSSFPAVQSSARVAF